MKNPHAQALRAIPSEIRTEASRINGAKSKGRPRPTYRKCECGRLTAVLKSGELAKHKHLEKGE